MRFLVTGGAGFIGSHLAERLLQDGHEVTVLDNLSTGRFENIAAIEGKPRFTFIKDSVLSTPLVESLVRDSEGVFHLASAVGVKLIMERPVETIESIFQGTSIVMQAAARYHRRVLLTSTSEVYGKSDQAPFEEDGDRLEGPTHKHRWAYAAAKALDEFLALAHWRESRLPVAVVRLFNTVGPRQTGRYGMVLPNFVRAAIQDEDLVVHGDGKQTRCFCHVSDVVDALVKLINCPASHGQVVNVGSMEEVAIKDLAERVVLSAKSKSRVRFVPYESVYDDGFEDMQRRVPSIRKALSLVGWRPRITLDEIIADVIAHCRHTLHYAS